MKDEIVMGGGCFWCLEDVYKRFDGIMAITPAYGGGNIDVSKYFYPYTAIRWICRPTPAILCSPCCFAR